LQIREIKVDEEYNLRNKAAYLEFRIGTPPGKLALADRKTNFNFFVPLDPVQPAIEDLLQLIADVYKVAYFLSHLISLTGNTRDNLKQR
jgi:hypothetical protein